MFGKESAKLMFGCNAVHVPMWMKVQDMVQNGVIFVGASRSTELRYGNDKTHQLVLGEMIIRPHLVLGSDHCKGHGITALAKELDVDQWLNGDLILDPIGKFRKMKEGL